MTGTEQLEEQARRHADRAARSLERAVRATRAAARERRRSLGRLGAGTGLVDLVLDIAEWSRTRWGRAARSPAAAARRHLAALQRTLERLGPTAVGQVEARLELPPGVPLANHLEEHLGPAEGNDPDVARRAASLALARVRRLQKVLEG